MYNQEEELRKEWVRQIRLIPVALVYAAVSTGIFVFLSSDNFIFSQSEMPGVTRHLWLFSAIVLLGFASCCFVGSFTRLIWLHLIAIRLKAKVRTGFVLWQSSKELLIGFVCVGVYQFLVGIIDESASTLNRVLYYRFRNADLLWDMGIGFLCLCFTVGFAVVIYKLLELPFTAKEEAEKYA